MCILKSAKILKKSKGEEKCLNTSIGCRKFNFLGKRFFTKFLISFYMHEIMQQKILFLVYALDRFE